MDKKIEELIKKYAIKNAIDYNGKASSGAVISKVISKMPSLKLDMKELGKTIAIIVKEINSMSKEEQNKLYELHKEEFDVEYEEKLEKTSKPNISIEEAKEGEFATRFAPEPSGYLHIGHAKSIFISKELVSKYKGRLFLYFDDTNPEKESQEFVDKIKEDLKWLDVNFDGEYYASDNIELMYEMVRKLFLKKKAYVCECPPEVMKLKRMKMEECEHRKNKIEDNKIMFEEMLKGKYKENSAVVRFIGEMNSENTTLRDPVIFRIKISKHYRQGDKYIVWPTYEFNTPIMDSTKGITDAVRSKEYELREATYIAILKALELRIPKVHHEARLEIKGTITSKREVNKLIDEKKLDGYDDPRLVTLIALRERGIKVEAIKNFVLRSGLSKTNTIVDISILLAEDKRIVDQDSKRLFYIENPILLKVPNLNKKIELNFHPTNNLGSRTYALDGNFYIPSKEANEIKIGEIIRLKDLQSIIIKSKDKEGINADIYEGNEGLDKQKKVLWIPKCDSIECEIILPGELLNKNGEYNEDSLSISKGYVESAVKKLKNLETAQLERFGFCAFKKIKEEMAHFVFITK